MNARTHYGSNLEFLWNTDPRMIDTRHTGFGPK